MTEAEATYPPISFKTARIVNDAPVVLKSGAFSLQTVTHVWAVCFRCGEGTYVDSDDLKAAWSCPACQKASTRKTMGDKPVCKGRTLKGAKIEHEPVEMTTKDPHPGRPCRMTYHCTGRHRATATSP